MDPRLRPLVIIDDNEDDLFILKMVLQKAGVPNPVRGFAKAEDAMAFLSTTADEDRPENAVLPLVCFVDVRMTGFDGFEFIEWVRNHAVFDRMALIVISASDDPRDLTAAAKLGAQCYVMKYPAATVVREILRETTAHRERAAAREAFALPFNLFLGRKPLPPVLS